MNVQGPFPSIALASTVIRWTIKDFLNFSYSKFAEFLVVLAQKSLYSNQFFSPYLPSNLSCVGDIHMKKKPGNEWVKALKILNICIQILVFTGKKKRKRLKTKCLQIYFHWNEKCFQPMEIKKKVLLRTDWYFSNKNW